MTIAINYAAEVRASRARHEAKIAEAKAELEAFLQRNPLNPTVRRGRPRTNATRDRLIYRAAVAGVSHEELAERYDLAVGSIARIVSVERGRLEAEDTARETADTAKRSALWAGMHDGRMARRTRESKRAARGVAMAQRNREMALAYAAGESTKALGARYGIGPRAVIEGIRCAVRAGAVAIPETRFQKQRQHVERDRAIYAAACRGISYRTLATIHGLSEAYIRELVDRERKTAEGRAA